MSARLNVNIDHVATVREARKTIEPSVVAAAVICEQAGADGITVHLRGDRRHIQDRDIELLRQTVTTYLNVEMAAADEMIEIALTTRPDAVSLVPESPNEITTEGGLDVVGNFDQVKDVATKLRDAGIFVSIFTDPVAEQLASSMARPGANLTGLTMSVGYQLDGKRVELLKDIKPSLSRLALLAQPDNTTARAYVHDTETAGRALGIGTRTFEARTSDDLPRAFAAMVEWQADGVITLADALLFSQRDRIVTLATNNRLPGVHPEVEFPLAGGLLSYGPSLADLFRRSASYVDKIVKGALPAQLPIEQPSKLELVLNLKTAQALGLTISRDFLLRVDEVIE